MPNGLEYFIAGAILVLTTLFAGMLLGTMRQNDRTPLTFIFAWFLSLLGVSSACLFFYSSVMFGARVVRLVYYYLN